MERREYDNGLVAIAERMPEKRKIQLYVGIDVGSKNEEKKGGLHLLEHRMFGSNEHMTSKEFVEAAEYEGIRLNAGTSLIETAFDCYVPGNKLELAIKLAFRAITNRSYNREEFINERNQTIKTELITYERSPFMRFKDRLLFPKIFEGTPLEGDPIGTPQSLKSLELFEVLNLKDSFYVPNIAKIAVAGAVDYNVFFEEIEKTFGTSSDQWKYTPVQQPNLTWKLEPRIVYKEFHDLKDFEDPEIDGAIAYIAYQINSRDHPDEVGIYLLQHTLGTGLTSYLFQELREKRGIGYAPDVDYFSFRGNGFMTLGVPMLMPEQIEETVDVMQDIIEKLRTEPLPQRDFEGNKMKFLSIYDDILDLTEERAGQRLDRELEKHYYDLMDVPREVERISRGELQDIAKRNFSGDPLIVIASAPGYQNRFSHLATK